MALTDNQKECIKEVFEAVRAGASADQALKAVESEEDFAEVKEAALRGNGVAKALVAAVEEGQKARAQRGRPVGEAPNGKGGGGWMLALGAAALGGVAIWAMTRNSGGEEE